MGTSSNTRIANSFTGLVVSLCLLSGLEIRTQTVCNNGARITIPQGSYLVMHGDYIATAPSAAITLDGVLSTTGNLVAVPGALFVSTDATGTLTFSGSGEQSIEQPGIIHLDGMEISGVGNILRFQSDQSMTLHGPLVIHPASNLILESSPSGTGSLITLATATGNALIQRYIAGWSDPEHGWHVLSSPVQHQAIDTAFTSIPDTAYGFFLWLEPDSLWVDYKNTTNPPTFYTANGYSNDFVTGRGYKVAYKQTRVHSFTGPLNNATVPVTGLTNTGGGIHAGWNLLGNPFPCAVQWNQTDGDNGWALTNISGTAKVWDEASASYHDIYKGDIIPAMQGFLVQVLPGGGTGSLKIFQGDRIHDTTQWYKGEETNVIRLTAVDSAGSTAQECVIRFQAGATATFDRHFDSHFLSGYAPEFYSSNAGHNLSTDVYPRLQEELTIPLNFRKNKSSFFSIVAGGLSGLNPPSPVYLTDLKTQVTQNLTLEPVYRFEASPQDDPSRFLLHFKPLGQEEPAGDRSWIQAWYAERRVFIVNPFSITGTIRILNTLGQSLLHVKLSGDREETIGLSVPSGVYFIQVTGRGYIYCRRIIVH